MATNVLLLAFYLLHHLLLPCHHRGHQQLLPAMLTIASTIPGMNMEVVLLISPLGVMGIITPYGTGLEPNLLRRHGHLPTKDWLRLGTILAPSSRAALLLIGHP